MPFFQFTYTCYVYQYFIYVYLPINIKVFVGDMQMHTQLFLKSRTHWCKSTVRPTGKLTLQLLPELPPDWLHEVHFVVYEQKDTKIRFQVHTFNFCNILSVYTQQ